MDDLKRYINQGIIYEDDFVATYLDVLNSQEFMDFFGENQGKAQQLINTLIKESRYHKNTLVNILSKI
jgi:hypothetical protein